MDSDRKKHFKEFINKERQSATRRSMRQRSSENKKQPTKPQAKTNRKRKKLTNEDNSNYVTKLRRANTADFESIGMRQQKKSNETTLHPSEVSETVTSTTQPELDQGWTGIGDKSCHHIQSDLEKMTSIHARPFTTSVHYENIKCLTATQLRPSVEGSSSNLIELSDLKSMHPGRHTEVTGFSYDDPKFIQPAPFDEEESFYIESLQPSPLREVITAYPEDLKGTELTQLGPSIEESRSHHTELCNVTSLQHRSSTEVTSVYSGKLRDTILPEIFRDTILTQSEASDESITFLHKLDASTHGKPSNEAIAICPEVVTEITPHLSGSRTYDEATNLRYEVVIKATPNLSGPIVESNLTCSEVVPKLTPTQLERFHEVIAINPEMVPDTSAQTKLSNEAIAIRPEFTVETKLLSEAYNQVTGVCSEVLAETTLSLSVPFPETNAPRSEEMVHETTTDQAERSKETIGDYYPTEDIISSISPEPVTFPAESNYSTNFNENLSGFHSATQCMIITTKADIHIEPSTSSGFQLKNNTLNCQFSNDIVSREEEIKVCLQEIRKDSLEKSNNTEDKTVDDYDDNAIIMVIEPVEEEDMTIVTKKYKETRLRHIDFLSEDECFEWSSSSWEPESETNYKKSKSKKNKKTKKQLKKKRTRKQPPEKQVDNELQESIQKEVSMQQSTGQDGEETEKEDTRKKRKKVNKAKERLHQKSLGLEYITKTGKKIEAKTIKENPCIPGKCPNECFNITEERRNNIFAYYWSLIKARRRDWIVSHSIRERVKRKRTSEVDSRREWSIQYFINENEGQRKVCQQFILNTLDIRQRFVHSVITNSVYGTSKDDQRGKHIPPNKTSQALIQSVKTYIENLPAVPSHYCRKNSKRFYLPQDFKNLTNLYRLYKETKQSEGVDFVGEKVFKNIFYSEYNISFHVPRKDKCVKCIKYENDETGQYKSEKELHLQDKEETYARFKVHQKANIHDSKILCTTFDLQKVLNTPYGKSMLLYYSMKLAVYNLTFYESQTREGFCFTWNETQGKRGANEICTMLSKYIEKVDSRGTITHLLLYCDSCAGQNKNRIVLACLSLCLKKCTSLVSIQINYLLPGHTFMPVDSMHSIIEKSVTNTIIWAPSQWATVFALARKSPKPYEVETLNHKCFEGWDAISDRYFRGNLEGKISKVRTVTFKKSTPDKIYVKYSMATDAESETIDIVAKNDQTPKKVYKVPLPISKKKFTHLMKLCSQKTIPEQYQREYKILPNGSNVKDVLPDTDIEDEDII